MNSTTYILLGDGYCVSSDFYTALIRQVEAIVPALDAFESYTLKALCGDAFWRQLSNGERRMAGRCMAHMVSHKILPLTFAKTKHEYPKRYIRT